MDYLPREMRLSSTVRGILIAVLVAGYAWVVRQPAASMTASFLIAAGLQLVVIGLRRFLPHERLPQALYLFELLADVLSVFLFVVGVYGGILKTATAA